MYLAFHVTKFETKIQERKPSYHYAENVPAPQTTNQVKLNIHDWYMLNKQGIDNIRLHRNQKDGITLTTRRDRNKYKYHTRTASSETSCKLLQQELVEHVICTIHKLA